MNDDNGEDGADKMSDTGMMDTEMMDTGTMDTEMMDTEMMDTEMMDTGMMDTGMMDTEMKEMPHTFTITIDNISGDLPYRAVNAFNTPVGAMEPAPVGPGSAYTFEFYAAVGERLSFATMFVHSNDLFYATGDTGLALFDESGMPVTGDVTHLVTLYDAGTETNQAIGEGVDQAPRQAGPNSGAVDADNRVRMAMDEGIPQTTDVLQVTLSYNMGMFTATIQNVSTESTLMLSDGSTTAAPIAPGVFVIHGEGAMPLFKTDMPDDGFGLEALAEDGDPNGLVEMLSMKVGPSTPFAPGIWATHGMGEMPLFTANSVDSEDGLEALAEDGDPSVLAAHLEMKMISNGVFNTPSGASEPGPLLPGESYVFTVEATQGEYLSFATMFVQSNDLFVAPDSMGIPLFDTTGNPISGDVTEMLTLWDAGTEQNEVPGIGEYQAPRQSAAGAGMVESLPVAMVQDMYYYPGVTDLVRVTVTL